MEAGKDDIYDPMDQVKVLVATPNYTNTFESAVHTNHIECVSRWREWGIDFNWTIIGRTFVQFARTQLCQVACDGGFTHLFFVDDDAVIDPEILPKFIKHEKDIVIAPYPMRKYPHVIGVLESEDREAWRDHADYRNLTFDDMNKGLRTIDGGGTHCMLINVNIFYKKGDAEDQAEDPNAHLSFFEEDEQAVKTGPGGKGHPFFVMPKGGTEDMYFCYRAKSKGIEIWCDTDVFADHVGFAPIITKAWAQHGEESLKAAKSNGKYMALMGSDQRSDNVIVVDKPANLV